MAGFFYEDLIGDLGWGRHLDGLAGLRRVQPDEYEAIHQQSLSRIELNAANLEFAKAKNARNEKLVRTGAVTPEEYEETRAAVLTETAKITASRADANRTAVDLKYTVLTSPINGRIDRAFVTKGNLLTGGQASGTLLTKIVNEQPMYVYFDVDERSLLRYLRQKAESRATPRPGQQPRSMPPAPRGPRSRLLALIPR